MADELAGEVTARLQDAGLRATRPRLAVIRALRVLGGHQTADELYAHLARNDVLHSRTSVYNSLVALADAGLVRRADLGRGAMTYEEAGAWHHHFVCRRCGRVSDVSCVVGAKPCLTPREDVGVVDEAQVLFHGTCHRCLDADATPDDQAGDLR